MRSIVFLLSLSLLAGCDNFNSVQQTDTIEAYEGYLQSNPNSRWRLQASTRLEELYLDKAKKAPNLEVYDAYLKRFPSGKLRERAMDERRDFLFNKSMEMGTAAGWDKYLKEYPKLKKEKKEEALKFKHVAEYRKHLALGTPKVKKINLAENPKGPLDGWGFWVPVTNNGPKTLKRVDLTMVYLDKDDKPIRRKEWPAVSNWFPVPIEEEYKRPFRPKTTRTWWYTEGNPPKGWAEGKVKFYPSRVVYQ